MPPYSISKIEIYLYPNIQLFDILFIQRYKDVNHHQYNEYTQSSDDFKQLSTFENLAFFYRLVKK